MSPAPPHGPRLIWRAAWPGWSPGGFGPPWAWGLSGPQAYHLEATRRRPSGLPATMLLTVWVLVYAALIPAAALATEDRCDWARRYETLQASDQQTLQRGVSVLQVQTHTGSPYHVGYVYYLLPYPQS